MKKWIGLLLALSLLFSVGVALGAKEKVDPAVAYAEAQRLLEAGDLFVAADAFKALKKYEDSPSYLAYTNARILTMQMDYEGALAAFRKLEGFLDADAQAAALPDMMLVPLCTGGVTPMEGSALRYGLMDGQGKQVTACEWNYIVGLACIEGEEGNEDHETGIAAEPHHVTAYLVFDGTMDYPEYGLPVPRENEYRYGLIDATGRVLVRANQGQLLWCSYGLAAFRTEDGKVRVFDLDDGDGQHAPVGTWDEVTMLGKTYDSIAVREGEQWFYVDRAGQKFAGPFEAALPMCEGLGAVCLDGKWGYVNAQGEMAIDAQYEDARSFAQGMAAVKQNGAFHFITPDGAQAFDGSFEDAGAFSSGVAKAAAGGQYGFVDAQGQWVVEASYDQVEDFHSHLHIAAVERDGKWGVIDAAGKEILKLQYDGIHDMTWERTILAGQGDYYGEFTDQGKAIGKMKQTYYTSYGNHVHLTRLEDKDFTISTPTGKAVKKINFKYNTSTKYTMQFYHNMGISVCGINFEWENEYSARYLNAKGKEIQPVMDEAVPSGKALRELLPVSSAVPPVQEEAALLVEACPSLEEASLYPFLPDYTVADYYAKALPEEWQKRLTVNRGKTVGEKEYSSLHFSDEESGICVDLHSPLRSEDNSFLGFQERSVSYPVGDSAYYFGESAIDNGVMYNISVPEHEWVGPSVFYATLLQHLKELPGAADCTANVAKRAEAYPPVEIYAPDIKEKMLTAVAEMWYTSVVITPGSDLSSTPLFPYSATYTMVDLDNQKDDQEGWMARLTCEKEEDEWYAIYRYTDSKTGVKANYYSAQKDPVTKETIGFSEVHITLPNGWQYRISGEASSSLSWYEEFVPNVYYIVYDPGSRNNKLVSSESFYNSLKKELEGIGEDARPLCDAVQERLARVEEAQKASTQPELETITYPWYTWGYDPSLFTLLSEDAWRRESGAAPSWRDLLFLPATDATLGELMEQVQAGTLEIDAGSESSLLCLYEECEWPLTGEPGAELRLQTTGEPYCYIGYTNPLYNAEGHVMGYGTLDISVGEREFLRSSYAYAQDPNYQGTPVEDVEGRYLFLVDNAIVEEKDFVFALYNALVAEGSDAEPHLEILQPLVDALQ